MYIYRFKKIIRFNSERKMTEIGVNTFTHLPMHVAFRISSSINLISWNDDALKLKKNRAITLKPSLNGDIVRIYGA